MTDLLTATGENRADATGAVNWFVKYRDTPQDLAGSASKLFLGVQIQCAQCHDHKTEKWKTDDFRRFAQALFLLNGVFVNASARAVPGSARTEVLALPGDDDEKIKSLYLRTLSRQPDAGESAAAKEVLATPAIEDEEPAVDPKVDAKTKDRKGNGRGKGVIGAKGAKAVKGRAAQGKKAAYEDLFWALLNSSEFALNH